jgi:mannose-binding lectin 1
VINAATPRMGLFICLIIAFQLTLAGGYVYYKRRRNGMPKKFL